MKVSDEDFSPRVKDFVLSMLPCFSANEIKFEIVKGHWKKAGKILWL